MSPKKWQYSRLKEDLPLFLFKPKEHSHFSCPKNDRSYELGQKDLSKVDSATGKQMLSFLSYNQWAPNC